MPRLNATTVLTQASQLTRSALMQLPLGTYIVQCPSTTDFPVTIAYGVLLHYGNLESYHTFTYVDAAYAFTYHLHCNGSSINSGWHWSNVWHNDVAVTITQGGAAQINLNSGNIINYTTFINGYVINTNNIVAQFYTYSNLIYVKLYTDQGAAAPAGTYTIRCIHGQLA